MKLSRRFTISVLLLFTLFFSLACQTLLGGKPTPDGISLVTPSPAVVTETVAVSAPTLTQAVQAPPSDNWIAFVKSGNLWLIHPDGSGVQKVTDGAADSGGRYDAIKWSREGSMLAYVRDENIYMLDMATMAETLKVEKVAGGLDWTLTGRRIVYDSYIYPGGGIGTEANDGLWMVLVNGRSTRRILPTFSDARVLQRPDMAADDRYAFAWGPCGDISGSCSLFMWDVEHGGVEKFPIDRLSACAWSPSELKVACTRDLLSKGEVSEVIIANVDGDVLKTIPASSNIEQRDIFWSPDAQWLVVGYFDQSGGVTDLVSLKDDSRRFLAKGLPLAWSPDSQWILVAEDGWSIASKLSLVNVNTGVAIFLTDAEGYNAVWQPETPR